MTDDKRLLPTKEVSGIESSKAEHSETDTQKDSSADSVNRHLQELENSNNENLEILQIEEQSFSDAELARLVNNEKLQSLLNQSDEFLSHLSGEINGFDEGSDE
ncbi:hypothetical protein [Psychrobacter urativorans]|uniref:hypothetical protein n=1 Tax=Psychrobacter urativorans TaxID=45610 RepID=UPI001D118B49|nr:hypothetical protein [Psychrobacter urativorans]